jgi:addiction module HigA family antidote
MAMHNPPHPGGIIRRQCLEPLGLSVTDAAKALGVTRQALSDLVNERAGVSVEMAIDPAVEGVWLQSGDVARNADGLRPLAGSQPNRENPGALIQGRMKSLRTLHPRERLP